MTDPASLDDFLSRARVDPAVFELRPDYRALLIAAAGLSPGTGDHQSETLLQRAEDAAQQALQETPVEHLPHIAAWREAYRAFGAKPQRTRNSVEALLRRVGGGLPRTNRLTDIYNAVSVLHQIPVGGEDLSRYAGAPQLILATGAETFDTVSGGQPVMEHPEPGEVVWRDDDGVTCRRWNWRQARRTQLSGHTTTALFILDALTPLTEAALDTAGDDLCEHLTRLGSGVALVRRLLEPQGD